MAAGRALLARSSPLPNALRALEGGRGWGTLLRVRAGVRRGLNKHIPPCPLPLGLGTSLLPWQRGQRAPSWGAAATPRQAVGCGALGVQNPGEVPRTRKIHNTTEWSSPGQSAAVLSLRVCNSGLASQLWSRSRSLIHSLHGGYGAAQGALRSRLWGGHGQTLRHLIARLHPITHQSVRRTLVDGFCTLWALPWLPWTDRCSVQPNVKATVCGPGTARGLSASLHPTLQKKRRRVREMPCSAHR